jgi:hypothetical protein
VVHDIAQRAPAHAKVNLFSIYGVAAIVTLLAWIAVAVLGGPTALVTVMILTGLEVTFSFDNAVVNSKLITQLSPAWQKAFMTVGILVAVFVVRFALPIFIVQLTAGLGFTDVVALAVNQPAQYAEHLEKAGPVIDAFGGTFLLMIGIGYFLDSEKDEHWIGWLESRLAPLGRFDNIPIFVMLAAAVVVFFTIGGDHPAAVLVAAVVGILLHVGLDLFAAIFDDPEEGETAKKQVTVLVGAAAAVMFVRLEILDASFSFDGVIGAFAITTAILVIMAGLGAGAMWVRSMTVHLVRAGTLAKYKYLEHGAHWAITALGVVMYLKLYGVHLAEWFTGGLGIVFIGLAVGTSVIQQRREPVLDKA